MLPNFSFLKIYIRISKPLFVICFTSISLQVSHLLLDLMVYFAYTEVIKFTVKSISSFLMLFEKTFPNRDCVVSIFGYSIL